MTKLTVKDIQDMLWGPHFRSDADTDAVIERIEDLLATEKKYEASRKNTKETRKILKKFLGIK
jgi:hypothetical protein